MVPKKEFFSPSIPKKPRKTPLHPWRPHDARLDLVGLSAMSLGKGLGFDPSMAKKGFRVWGLGVWGFVFRVWGLGFEVRVWGLESFWGFGVWGLVLRGPMDCEWLWLQKRGCQRRG